MEHNKISWKEASVNNSTIEVEAIYDHIRQIVNYSHKDKYNPQNGLRAYDMKRAKKGINVNIQKKSKNGTNHLALFEDI